MNYAEVHSLLFDHLRGIVGLPSTILWPNVEATPKDEHMVANILMNEADGLGLVSLNRVNGIFQIDIAVRDGKGTINAHEYADILIAGFPRGTQLSGTGYNIRIDRPVSVSPALTGNGWHRIPVRVTFDIIF